MKPQIKKYKQHNIKSFIGHHCIKCRCNKYKNDNYIVSTPKCCLKSKNICRKCNNKINTTKYNKIVVIDNNLNIIKCSNSSMKDIFPADVYVHMSEIKNSGFGVFANKKFIKNEIIEIAPYVILENYNTHQQYGILKNYVYSMKNTSNVALSLGFGSLYNCSKTPNVNFVIDNDSMTRLMIFYACCDINTHDELYINYGYEIDDNMENNINNVFPSNLDDNIFSNSSDRIFDPNDMSIDDNDYQQVLIKQIKNLTI